MDPLLPFPQHIANTSTRDKTVSDKSCESPTTAVRAVVWAFCPTKRPNLNEARRTFTPLAEATTELRRLLMKVSPRAHGSVATSACSLIWFVEITPPIRTAKQPSPTYLTTRSRESCAGKNNTSTFTHGTAPEMFLSINPSSFPLLTTNT